MKKLINMIASASGRISLAVAFCFAAMLEARAGNLVQEFYLPMPEQQIYQANSAIIGGTGSTIFSTFSIVVTGNGTVIYYDQWEDGYEADLSNPTQPTTQIWGDGNDAHGIPPGFAHNPLGLSAGTVITLTNNVTLPRNPSTILWDARDRIGANKALVISRAAWPSNPGPVFAGAAGVLSTIDYGTNYISPVGQDLTNINLFKYVGMFVMAAQNNTVVTIDPKGNGVGTTNIVLNQGESYLVNGGILKGGRVTATKPIQANLLIGHVGASYASDWFTLYPVQAWDNAYYTPVCTAASGNPAYVYLYNPGTNAISINYTTRVGSGSFSVPGTNGVFQFQMPVASGASFVSAGGQHFFALCTVGANNSSDTAYNWGFSLVPKTALTTEVDVGWGPGSADGTVDGSPVWVTALANTTLYADYKGDHAGPLIDPNGNHYDVKFTVSALQSQKIFDPSKNQTGMRVYTVDGALITAAWGEDPDAAQPGNPYIDAGTTVLPFPVPVVKKTSVIVTDTPPAGLSIGDVIEYAVEVDNRGLLPLGNTVVIDAPSTNLTYVLNSTTVDSNSIPDSASGTPFPLDAPGYNIPIILSQGTTTFRYRFQLNASGAASNYVNVAGTTISAQTYLAPPPTNGASLTLNFTDTNGVPVGLYPVGANVFVTMTNAVGNTSSNSVQTISVTVVDVTHGDLQTISLAETGINTGVFRNTVGLPTSSTSGLGQQDGTLNVSPGDTLRVSYTDPDFGDGATNTATILVPTPNKQLYLSVNGSTNGVQALNRIDPVAYGHSPTRASLDLGGGVTGAIGIDGTASAAGTNTSSVTVSYTTGSGANPLMLVSVGTDQTGTINSVIYNGVALTSVTNIADAGATKPRVEIFKLVNPAAGTHNLVVTLSASANVFVGVNTFTNVNQLTPLGTASASANTSSATVTSATNQFVFGVICEGQAVTDSVGQVRQWSSAQGTIFGAGSTMAGATSVTMSWTPGGGSIKSAVVVVPIQPASSGGTTSTTFVQTPAFSSAFSMPSNNLVTITNFITVTGGIMPTNPAITATLQYNGVDVITLSNPAYSAANSNLVWSGILTSNVTIPAGQFIACIISNNQPGITFHIDYDSTSKPSKITLPASTVIQINSFGIYDAPYPGGNLVTTPIAGSTLYVRANVSDPFGSYDIISLGLAITGPNPGASLTNTLTDINVVTNDNLSKTYEYQWVTGPTTGGYNIAATAYEGTEGVTAAAGTAITATFLDLGTPSTTVFTSGASATVTNSFLAGSPVCVQVTDLNRNTNAATVDTVLVTLTSSAGDSELVTLIETGTNTGIFAGCINVSTNLAGAHNDGTLYAPVGTILTASYSDPTDPTDNTSATAAVQPPPGVPGVAMNKTILSPSGGQIGVNQPVTYNLQVVNTGSTILPNLSITDSFPSARLSYSSASLTPGTIAGGLLTWANLGALAPGQSTNITVTFNTLAMGPATNFATANAVSATNTSSVTLQVNSAALNVTKTLLSPTNSPVAVGASVVFRITIQNVGNTAINYLPLEDTFSGAYYQFISSTITNDGSGAGSLLWTNLAYPVALATNAIITNDITMKVVGQGSPAENTAIVDYAVDIFGNSVPTSSSTAGVITAAAAINGHVYNDLNKNGVYTNGDAGLSGVTLQLFTDPNGDGDPSDGALVQITTTDVNGYYELLNLNLGHYVVVDNDLPGYASSAPANNRLSINITSLTAFTNANFFQYLPSPSLYSTISGTVWNDANGNGTNDVGETGLANVQMDLISDGNTNGLVDSGEPVVATVSTDVNGNYSFAGVTPGQYVIREAVLYGYYSTGDSQPPNNHQISFVSTNGVVSNNNDFSNRQAPVAVNDTNSALYFVPTLLYPLTNDLSPNGDALIITNATSTNGILAIGTGNTNITFTPTNLGTATLTYTITDAHGGSSTAIISMNVTALSDLAVGKTGPASVLAAGGLTYTISITNLGPSPADFVVVTDALPASATFVSASGNGINNSGVVNWALGTLTNGQVSNITVTVTAPTSGALTNLASVSSPAADPNPTNNLTPPVTTSVTQVADVGIGKVASAFVPAASNLTYTISVTNFGPSSASSVVVTDALPAGVTFVNASGNGLNNSGVISWSFGTLTNGQVSNVTVTVTAPATGTITNVALVSSSTGDPNVTNNVTPPVTTSVTPLADLALGKTGLAGTTYGSNFDYTISVTNLGPSTAISLAVTDSLPAGLVFVSSVPATTVNASNQVIWTNLGDLAAGVVTNLTLTVNPTASGTITNVATGGSTTLDPNSTNNTAPPVVTVIAKATPAVTWTPTSPIVYGTSVGAGQNNASANVPGAFVYTPTNGVALPAGTNTLHVVFTPSDTNYVPVTMNVSLVVLPAPLSVTAANASRAFGQANPVFSGTLTGVTNGDNITATYLTVATTNSPTGTYSILPTLVDPNGRLVNYSVSTNAGTLTINNGTPVVTWTPTSPIVYGTPVGTSQNNASASVPGTFVYTSTNGAALPAGTNTLHVVFTPSDANYVPVSMNASLVVLTAPLTVTTANAARAFGQPNPVFSGTLTGVTNGDNITATYSTAATTNSPSGAYPILPSLVDPNSRLVNYSVTTNAGTLTISNATPIVTWTPAGPIVYGTPVGASQNNASANVPGAFAYTPTNGVGLPAATNTLHVVFTPTDTNYVPVVLNASLVVQPAPLTVTAANASRTFGQPNPILSGTLTGVTNGDNITATYSTTAATNSSAGAYPILPTLVDPNSRLVNYSVTTNAGTLTVSNASPVVTWTPAGPIVYGTPVSANQNNASANVPGTFAYTPTNGVALPAGTNTLHVAFTPTDTNYVPVVMNASLVVLPAPLSVTAANASRAFGQPNPILSGTLTGVINGDNITATYSTTATTNSAAGAYPILPSLVDPNGRLVNYTITTNAGTLTVLNASPVVTWTPAGPIVYGTPVSASQNNASANVPGTFVYTPTNGVALPAGTNTLHVVFTPTDTNYVPVVLNASLVVLPAPLSVTAANAARAFGQPNPVLVGTLTGITNSDNITATYSTAATTNSPAGSYPILPSLLDPNGRLVNYSVSTNAGTLTVSNATPVVTWTPAGPIVYGTPVGASQNNASANVPGTFVYTPTNGVAMPTGTNALHVVFTPSDTNYVPVVLNASLVVLPAPLTVTAANAARAFGQPNPTLSGTLTGVTNGDNITVIYSTAATTNSPVGTYPTLVSLVDPNGRLVNYTITTNAGTLTVLNATPVVTWTPAGPIVYGAPVGASQNNASASVPGAFVYTPTNGVALPAGTNTLHVVFTLTDTNYVPVVMNALLVVQPAPLTVTAANATRSFGQPNPVLSGTLTGVTNGDNITATYGTAATTNSPAGSYPILVSLVDPNSRLVNYTITTNAGTLTINTASPVVTWTPAGPIVYGTLVGTSQNNASANVPGTFVYTPTNGVALPAGTNNLHVVFTPSDTNYVPVVLNAPLVVQPAPLTVTAANASRVFGQPNPILSGTLTGVTNGDNITATYATTATTNSPAGTYPILPSLVDPNSRLVNYSVTTNGGTLTINNATPAVTWTPAGPIVYGTPVSASQNNASANVPGTFAYTPTNGVALPAGTNSLHVVFTPSDTNYVPVVMNASLVVLTAPLTVTTANAARAFGQPNPVFSGTLTGVTNGDNVTATYSTTAATNSPSGAYPILPTLVDPNGRLVNYTITTNAGTLTINTATPVVTWTPAGPIVYGTLVSASQNNASANVPGMFVYTPTNGVALPAGTNTLHVVFTPTDTNYVPVVMNASLAVLTAPLSVKAANATRAFGQPNPVFSGTLTGVTNGDNITATYTTAASSNSPAGSYPILPILLDPNSRLVNYAATTNAGTLTITNAAPMADLIVLLSGPTNVTLGSNFSYTVVVTNNGPATATNVVAKDKLPAGLTFVSASGGGVFSSNLLTWPTIPSLAQGATTNFIITVGVTVMGQYTNVALATSSTADPNVTNNNGSSPNSIVATTVTPAQFAILAGTNVLNPQTGLYEERVTVTNTGIGTVAAVRLSVGGLRTGVRLYNAAGTNLGVPYVFYNAPLNPNQSVVFLLEFLVPDRLPFTNTLLAEAVLPVSNGINSTNGVNITRTFLDSRFGSPRFVIEFTSVPGQTYTIIYSDDNMQTWKVATPSVTAGATATQWYDDGPPKTDSAPLTITSRLYRVIASTLP
ncbi:MAG: type fimbrial biosis protein PilY1 [Pedosphaera sp.]|nr:type fimbrial biosis protein PilY1 [Pedosphaera sp.]